MTFALSLRSSDDRLVLAQSDRQVSEMALRNAEAGYYVLPDGPLSLFDKAAQYRMITKLAPELAFDGHCVESLEAVAARPSRTQVIRPVLSPASKGCAFIVGPDCPLHETDRETCGSTLTL